MIFNKTKLYGITRKRDLKVILKTDLPKTFVKNANKQYKPFIYKYPKPRLIENPHRNLKLIQSRIKDLLFEMDYPDYVFSGIKGKSYIGNALYHINSSYFLKIDLSKFFPNTHREKIFDFFAIKLNMNNDIADIMTNLTTVNLKELMNNEIKEFLDIKKITSYNHLPSGSPISSVMSYLANIDMFDEIVNLCYKNNYIITIYVDDITISSDNPIDKKIVSIISKIIKKNYHKMNRSKLKTYETSDFKKITGCVIKKNELIIPNKTRYKISKLIKEEYTEKELNRLLGLIRSAQLFDKNKYNALKNQALYKLQELKSQKNSL